MAKNIEVLHTLLKLGAKDSSYLYYTLEANEGVSFYSTLKHQADLNMFIPPSLYQEYQLEQFDILTDKSSSFVIVNTPCKLKPEFNKILKELAHHISFDIIFDQELQ